MKFPFFKKGITQSKEIKKEVQEVQAKPLRLSEVAAQSLLRPHFTEKTSSQRGKNEYVFVVRPFASKHAIGRAVEELYGVDVEKVSIIKVHAKQRRFKKSLGFKPGFKKAIVRIRSGQNIEALSI